jgi:predicted nucleic-acid-binding protein
MRQFKRQRKTILRKNKMIFVDTNYFIRFYIKDIDMQFKEAKLLFEKGARSETKLFTSTIVIFEIYWLFSSFYEKTKPEVIDILKKTLSLNFIEIEERKVIAKALDVYESVGLDLEDCYNIAYSNIKNAESFLTFDKKLRKYLDNYDK